jgi:outer membrane protein TolC
MRTITNDYRDAQILNLGAGDERGSHLVTQTEDALANDYYLGRREGALAEMVSSSAEGVKLGREQFDQGHADMFTILRLSGESLAAKIELTKVRASRLRERVNLHLALGGDFKGTSVSGK